MSPSEDVLQELLLFALSEGLEDTDKTLSTAVLETHYFYHGCFVEDDYIVNYVDAIAHLPIQILQRRYDFVARMVHAEKMVSAQ